MDYYKLLDFATDFGYELSMSGAETYRVEESVYRILTAYGVESEVFAIPNCLIVSITSDDGHPLTYMRRMGIHGNDLDSVERYSALGRRICAEKPDPEQAMELLQQCRRARRDHHWLAVLLGYFLASAAFGIFFGGNLLDALIGGFGGAVAGASIMFMDRFKANNFFQTMLASFPLAFIPYLFGALGVISNPVAAIIGAVMTLIPGLLFTNAMRDIIYGDTNSGVNRIVQVFLIAAAIALGTGASWTLANALWGISMDAISINHTLISEAIACFIGCFGFVILFNIHGPGGLLCALGGVLTWLTYRIVCRTANDDIFAYFCATAVAALYSEIMARLRKYPAISYLVISAFPLIPGAGVYYTMRHAVRGDMSSFASQGIYTVAIAGVMAVGILLCSTLVRMLTVKTPRRNT